MFVRSVVFLTAAFLPAVIVQQQTSTTTIFDALVNEIKQWHTENPYACGQDTSTCAVQRLIDRFEACDEFRIVHGCDVSKPATLGWQVVVRLSGVVSTICGGTLVSPRHVVLSADCFKNYNGISPVATLDSLTVIVGAKTLFLQTTTPQQEHEVLKLAYHPKYTTSSIMNVAIIKLTRAVKISTQASDPHGVRPACLPSKSFTVSRPTKNCIISGYGAETARPLTGVGVLRYTVHQPVSNLACTYFHKSHFDEFFGFCAAGKFRGKISDLCSGDVGGGLVCKDESSGRWTLQGITGSGNCGGMPTLYADVFAVGLRSTPPIITPGDKCKSSSSSNDDESAKFWHDYALKRRAADNAKRARSSSSESNSFAVKPTYADLVKEIQDWQRTNPDGCGKDTTDCSNQRLIDRFEQCSAFRTINGCEVGNHDAVGWAVAVADVDGGSCSGTLVSPRHVITAAHCFGKPPTTYKPEDISVIVGALDSHRPTAQQQFQIAAFVSHPEYTSHRAQDSTILKLASAVQFTANGVRPLCLPSGSTSRKFSQCIVAGYGVNDTVKHSGTGILRYSVLQGVSDEACAYYNPNFDKVTSFCALGYRNNSLTDTCFGDSGGGVVCKDEKTKRWTLQGIVSYGSPQCGKRPGTLGWQAAVVLNGSLCGGTLVSSRHLVLSASCTKRLAQVVSNDKLYATIGALDVFHPAEPQRFEAESYAIHSSYSKKDSYKYDVAIVRLERDVPFAVSGVRPACLPSTQATRSFTQCILSSFGADQTDQMSDGRMRYTVLQAISDSACKYIYNREQSEEKTDEVFDTQISFCAFGAHQGNKTETCHNDGGTGLMCKDGKTGRWYLQGILSNAGGSYCGRMPGIYSDAYALGFQQSTVVSNQKPTTVTDPCKHILAVTGSDDFTAEHPLANVTKYMDDLVAELRRTDPQKDEKEEHEEQAAAAVSKRSEKKQGGLAKTATQTIADSGCKSNDKCLSNTCKSVELCVAALGGSQQNGEDENVLKQYLFTARGGEKRCGRVDICWPAAWVKFYANKVPTFNLMS